MSFWSKWFEEKKIKVDVNERNVCWLINEEMKRLYGLLDTGWANNDKNRYLFWNKIETFQNIIIELSKKDTDEDTRKAIADIQNQLADSIILGKDKE